MTKAVDAIIREAMARGEFDNLPGKGRPIDLTAYFDSPEEVRMAYALLKSAGIMPEEIELLKEIGILKEKLEQTTDATARMRLQKGIEDKRLKFNLMMERLKKGRGAG